MKIKVQRKQLKTVAKYLYRPEYHGEWTDLLIALEETFEIMEEILPTRRNKKSSRKRVLITPPPIPIEALPVEKRVEEYRSRNYLGHRITVHRGTPKHITICGSRGVDVVTSMENEFVNCHNCLLPKNQRKLETV